MSNLGQNILVLEDNDERIVRIRQLWPACTIVKTAQACIDKLIDFQFVTLLLDHDLGGEVMVDSRREDCGMEVVRWIVAKRPRISECVVHSHNTPAAAVMVQELKKAGYYAVYAPFGDGKLWNPK